MRVLVCGGREFGSTVEERTLFDSELILLDADFSVRTIIHGGARGADSMAGRWARMMGKEEIVFPANWKAHGKAAGAMRNQQMLTEGRPDVVVAFPGGRGTADMMRRTEAAGVRMIVVPRTNGPTKAEGS